MLAGLALAGGIVFGQTTQQQQIDQLQQEINQLQQKQKADETAAATTNATTNASVTADSHGFTIKSNDRRFHVEYRRGCSDR